MGEGMTEKERQEMNDGFKSVSEKIDTLTVIVNDIVMRFAVLDALLFGKNKENGIHGDLKKLATKVECLEKQRTENPGTEITKAERIEKIKSRALIIGALFGGSGFITMLLIKLIEEFGK